MAKRVKDSTKYFYTMDLNLSDAEDDVGSFEVMNSPTREELLPLLECPVCFELPLPPIRTCNQGHIICADCCPKLSGCPLCQSPITYGRNFFAEDFMNKSTMRCKYRADGCSAALFGSVVKDHVKSCKFRPLDCTICERKVLFRDFEKHLEKRHQISRWDINENGDRIIREGKKRLQQINNLPRIGAVTFSNLFLKYLFVGIAVSFLFDQFVEL